MLYCTYFAKRAFLEFIFPTNYPAILNGFSEVNVMTYCLQADCFDTLLLLKHWLSSFQ